jgi:hypothetical protein
LISSVIRLEAEGPPPLLTNLQYPRVPFSKRREFGRSSGRGNHRGDPFDGRKTVLSGREGFVGGGGWVESGGDEVLGTLSSGTVDPTVVVVPGSVVVVDSIGVVVDVVVSTGGVDVVVSTGVVEVVVSTVVVDVDDDAVDLRTSAQNRSTVCPASLAACSSCSIAAGESAG